MAVKSDSKVTFPTWHFLWHCPFMLQLTDNSEQSVYSKEFYAADWWIFVYQPLHDGLKTKKKKFNSFVIFPALTVQTCIL